MSAREAILRGLGGTSGIPAEPPPVYAPERRGDGDLFLRFAASLAAAAGRARALTDAAALAEALGTHAGLAAARAVWSSLPGHASRHPAGPPRRPQDLAELDVALLYGRLAVAESGAVWWVPRDALERAAGLLAEHVVLVVPRAGLVVDLHAAYARLDVQSARFGCFVCGPSKTADIEQALVTGAHGPRSLEVWIEG